MPNRDDRCVFISRSKAADNSVLVELITSGCNRRFFSNFVVLTSYCIML